VWGLQVRFKQAQHAVNVPILVVGYKYLSEQWEATQHHTQPDRTNNGSSSIERCCSITDPVLTWHPRPSLLSAPQMVFIRAAERIFHFILFVVYLIILSAVQLGSLISIVTGYRLDGRGSIPDKGRGFIL
jgi:hypothetical protein